MFKTDKTLIMGILNVTPDSFSDGGKYFEPEAAVSAALQMEKDGAHIIDIGGQSTRPGFVPISAEQELERIEPVLCALRKKTKLLISVDTFYPYVAQRALELGADIINDVTGFKNEQMFNIAANYGCGCVVMCDDDISEVGEPYDAVRNFFVKTTQKMTAAKISAENICLDPGIGFGKSYEQNLQLIANPDRVMLPGFAMMMAASRKRVIVSSSGRTDIESRDAATIAAHTAAILKGANIIRVHNVKLAAAAARTADALRGVNFWIK